MAYLAAQQSSSGGFAYSTVWGSAADANSTAYGLQALTALRQDPGSATWLKGGVSPVEALLHFQLPSGAFEWQPGQGANLLATAQAVPALLGKALPLPGLGPALRDALAYLRGQQQADGSFTSGMGSNVSPSSQMLAALASVGENPGEWRGASGRSLVDYLRQEALSVTTAAAAGQLAMALAMAGEDPRAFADLAGVIRKGYDAATGAFDAYQNVWSHALAMMGLAASGESVPAKAVTWLRNQQNEDGGWGWAHGQKSDSNSTALALQALLACGVTPGDAGVGAAIGYLHQQQTPDGGFAYDMATAAKSDANSTAVVVQGLLAAGLDPTVGWDWAMATSAKGRASLTLSKPLDSLLMLQRADGAFEWQAGAGANALATMQTIPALAKIAFPSGRAAGRGGDANHPRMLTTEATSRGSLYGSSAGAYAYYAVDYPGDGRMVTIRVAYAPADPVTRGGFGFRVYAPGGQPLGRGTPAPDSVGALELHASGAKRVRWLVQVYNYLPGQRVDYSVAAAGLPASTERPSSTSRLPNADAVSAAFAADDPVISDGVGLVVYGPLGEAVAGQKTGTPGLRVATFASRAAGTCLVQVYNYVDGLALRYTVSR
jgi:hypothetical protein